MVRDSESQTFFLLNTVFTNSLAVVNYNKCNADTRTNQRHGKNSHKHGRNPDGYNSQRLKAALLQSFPS